MTCANAELLLRPVGAIVIRVGWLTGRFVRSLVTLVMIDFSVLGTHTEIQVPHTDFESHFDCPLGVKPPDLRNNP